MCWSALLFSELLLCLELNDTVPLHAAGQVSSIPKMLWAEASRSVLLSFAEVDLLVAQGASGLLLRERGALQGANTAVSASHALLLP